MGSLRDQLMQKGLVTEESAKKAEADSRAREEAAAKARERGPRRDDWPRDDRPPRFDRPRDDRPRTGPRGGFGGRPSSGPGQANRPPPRAETAPVPKFAPLAGSKESHRQNAKAQLELDRKVRELVTAAQVEIDVGAGVFYFVTRKGKLRRLTLTEPQQKKLEAGELAVVERPDPGQIEHALVPADAAEQLLALFPKAVRFFNKPGAPVGFLSEDEIHKRASEADAPETVVEAPAEAPAADAGPLLTIRRAPLTPGG